MVSPYGCDPNGAYARWNKPAMVSRTIVTWERWNMSEWEMHSRVFVTWVEAKIFVEECLYDNPRVEGIEMIHRRTYVRKANRHLYERIA